MNRTAHAAKAVVVALLALVLAGADDPKQPSSKGPTVRLNRKDDKDTQATFDVAGLDAADLDRLAKVKWEPAEWVALFGVYVETKVGADQAGPAVLGSYRVEDGVLRFEPRFPLTPGVRYRAVFDPSRLPGQKEKKPAVVASFALPKPPVVATTVVTQVYPTRDKLPENQLKFYLHFSAPMSRGEAYDHIRLLDADGKPIEGPFLELGEELWDPEGKRFTLFIDPGRIKKGLKPREDLGPVLEEGKSYTLVIDQKWADAKGNPLKETFRKKFRAVAADERPIDPKAWKLQAPPAGKAEPLTVALAEPLDHALLHRLLWVLDADGKKVPGTVSVTDEETRWHFTPEKPWRAGRYRLVADTVLEDLAGNQIGKPFEVDVFKPIQREIKAETVELPFEVK